VHLLDRHLDGWYHPARVKTMAAKKKMQLSRSERRGLRMRQVLFTIIAVLVIASFVISYLAR